MERAMTETPQPKWTWEKREDDSLRTLVLDGTYEVCRGWRIDSKLYDLIPQMCDDLNMAEEQRHATEPGSTSPDANEVAGLEDAIKVVEALSGGATEPPPHKCWPVYNVHRGNVCGSCDKQMENPEPQTCPACYGTGQILIRVDGHYSGRADCPYGHASTPPAHSEEDYEHGPGLCTCPEHARKPEHTAVALAHSEVEGLINSIECGSVPGVYIDYWKALATRAAAALRSAEVQVDYERERNRNNTAMHDYEMAALRYLSVQPEVEALYGSLDGFKQYHPVHSWRGNERIPDRTIAAEECVSCELIIAVSALLDFQRKP